MAQGIVRVDIFQISLGCEILSEDGSVTKTLNRRIQVARISVIKGNEHS